MKHIATVTVLLCSLASLIAAVIGVRDSNYKGAVNCHNIGREKVSFLTVKPKFFGGNTLVLNEGRKLFTCDDGKTYAIDDRDFN